MALSSSRFKYTPLVTFNDQSTYGRWISPQFLQSTPAQTYVVPAAFAGRLDLISNQLYQTPEYYWAIVAFNAPEDPLNWPNPGDVINIPSLGAILAEF